MPCIRASSRDGTGGWDVSVCSDTTETALSLGFSSVHCTVCTWFPSPHPGWWNPPLLNCFSAVLLGVPFPLSYTPFCFPLLEQCKHVLRTAYAPRSLSLSSAPREVCPLLWYLMSFSVIFEANTRDFNFRRYSLRLLLCLTQFWFHSKYLPAAVAHCEMFCLLTALVISDPPKMEKSLCRQHMWET